MKQVGKRLSCAALTAVLIAGGAMEGAAAVQIQNKPIYGAAAAQKAPQAYARELFKDSFDDGSNWQSNTAAVKFAQGQARIQGGGPNNSMKSVSEIFANNFLIQADLVVGEGNKNCNAKFAFKAADGFEAQRLQLRFDFPNNQVFLEKVTGNTIVTSYAKAANLTVSQGEHHLAIEVKGDTITAWLDDQQIITAKNAEIAQMKPGRLLVAGQFPGQDFAVDNFLVTTDEKPSGEECTVKLETYTDGKPDPANKGGTLTADRTSGYSGDSVKLKTKANHGYVFSHFTTSTDNLVTITNNRFQLNEKFKEITVTAHFKTREAGKDELFFDDFGGEQDGTLPEGVTIQEGELIMDVPEGKPSSIYQPEIAWEKIPKDGGYRISADVRRTTQKDGTAQIIFRSGKNTEQNYALLFNTQGSAIFRKNDGKPVDLKKCNFQLTEEFTHIAIELMGNKVSLFVGDKEVMAYEDADNWGDTTPQAALMQMTAGAPTAFDQLMIERICQKKPIEVVSVCDGKEDTAYACGAAVASAAQAEEGSRVTLSAIAKAGYRFKAYEVEGNDTVQITDGTFVMPEGEFNSLKIKAVFEKETLREPKTFYVDAVNGEDSASGTSEQEAWKSLKKIKEAGAFVPGDKILLKRGSVFKEEQLTFTGMGQKGKPIEISAYGEGALPRLDGNGKLENVISLSNQEYIKINNLEITNLDPRYNKEFALNKSNNKETPLRAINVSISDFGTASGIEIEDCYIHDINGNINLKWNGGIFFDVKAGVEDGKLKGVPSKYDGILISGCTFERVDRSGIKLVSSAWCNQWEANSPGVPVNWYPSTNVVVRDNYIEYIGGDGITVRDTDGALIEHNLVKDCRYQNTGYNVGIWPFEAANTVLQYNEAYNTHGVQDGQGLDCDHASSNSVMQYNYSHNNEGGFMLIMGGYPHTGATVRYNISQNDRDKTFEFAQGCPKGTTIYNNTIYSDKVLDKGVFFLSNTTAGLGVNDIYVFNNLFQYPAGQKMVAAGESDKMLKHLKAYNNAYAGGMEAFTGDANALHTKDAGMVDPGKAPEVNETKKAITAESGLLDGYKLKPDSVLIDRGITVDEAYKHFGGSQLVDGRALSPRELFEKAKAGNSIDYVMGNNFPKIPNAAYDKDFFAGSNMSGKKPDIGAAEYKETEKP